MAERKIRHVGDVFRQHNGESGGNSESEFAYNFNFKAFKNKQAPLPPGGPVSLPKIGNYQPKMLLESGPGGNNPIHTHENVKVDTKGQSDRIQGSAESHAKKDKLIIGDKDIPITIESNELLSDSETPIPAPRRKRRAPMMPDDNTDVIPRSSEQTTSNPLFGRSLSVGSDEETFDMDTEILGGDIDFGPGIDNPGFSDMHLNSLRTNVPESNVGTNENMSELKHTPNGDVAKYPYIPPPDYDDEEVTMTFGEEERDHFEQDFEKSRVYKEFQGEDFARYLRDDEDYEFDSRPSSARSMKGKPAPRPPKHDNRFIKKGDKPKKKSKRNENDIKRNTIRDFSFSDSKIGWGDRTVRSTSAKGRYIKREKDRKRIDTHEQSGPGSYEDFLRVRNGLPPQPLESPNSSDSGVEVDIKNHENLYYHSQPKQLRNGKYDKKPSMWQKLTWRFKKSVDISRIDKT